MRMTLSAWADNLHNLTRQLNTTEKSLDRSGSVICAAANLLELRRVNPINPTANHPFSPAPVEIHHMRTSYTEDFLTVLLSLSFLQLPQSE